MTLPPVLYIDDLRKLMPHRSAEWIRDFLHKNKLSVKDGTGHVCTTDVLLEENFPEAARAMARRWADVQTGAAVDPYRFDDIHNEDA
jgi:hypothetical protein